MIRLDGEAVMRILVPNQVVGDERRVALVPGVVKSLVAAGHQVDIERGAGAGSFLPDARYREVGAAIVDTPDFSTADIVLTIHPPTREQASTLKHGALLIGLLRPGESDDVIHAARAAGAIPMALEKLPRISRAQAMDVLSSQANLAGYLSVILAAERSPKIFPMLMTAAGTLQPAKVFVIGVGVAGLQAIATAKRLGAVVSAYDVRPAVKEQVQSVGARFIELPLDTSAAATAGGYAAEQSAEQQQKQQALMSKTIADSDVVITTALIPGKPAPKLVSEEAVRGMLPGSVIVDLAAERGGNCALTEPGQIVERDGVTIIGYRNYPSRVPMHASQLYSSNLQKLLALLIQKDGTLKVDQADEIIAGIILK
jgi:NAD(P) transhydrogenase subunit alpha